MKKLLFLLVMTGSWCLSNAQTPFSPWGLEFYFSPQLVDYINDAGRFSNTPSVQSINSNSRFAYAFSTGIHVRRQLHPKWAVSAGLVLHSSSESFVRLRWGAQREGGIPVVTESFNSIGIKSNGTNYLFLEMPLSVRYYLNGERFRVYFRSGVQPGLLLSSQQSLEAANVTEDNQVIEGQVVNTEGTLITPHQLNISALLACGLEWRMNQRLRLFIEPEAKLALRPNTGNDGNRSRPGLHRYLFGSRLGLVLHFGRS